MGDLSRSEISKKAWRARKKGPGKGICAFCGKKIWAGGVTYNGKKWHKGCLESYKFGLTKKQAGVANPRGGYPKTDIQRAATHFGVPVSKVTPSMVRTLPSRGGLVSGAANPWYMGAGATLHYPPGTRVKLIEPNMLTGEPKGTKGIVIEEAGSYATRGYRVRTKDGKIKFWHFSITRPIGQRSDNPRRTRDSYRFYGAKELNPRPPAVWWSRMWAKTAAGYPRKAGETLEHWRADISRITAGIWWKYPEATRQRLIRRYDKLATPSKALVNVAGVQMLKCPACGNPVPISRQNVYLKCPKCGAPLRHVNVTRR